MVSNGKFPPPQKNNDSQSKSMPKLAIHRGTTLIPNQITVTEVIPVGGSAYVLTSIDNEFPSAFMVEDIEDEFLAFGDDEFFKKLQKGKKLHVIFHVTESKNWTKGYLVYRVYDLSSFNSMCLKCSAILFEISHKNAANSLTRISLAVADM